MCRNTFILFQYLKIIKYKYSVRYIYEDMFGYSRTLSKRLDLDLHKLYDSGLCL